MPRSTRPELPKDFLDLLSCLAKARCRYLVVGGHALAVAGHPRFTQDLDLLVEPTVQNARKVGRARAAFGFSAHAEAVVEQFAHPKRIATRSGAPLDRHHDVTERRLICPRLEGPGDRSHSLIARAVPRESRTHREQTSERSSPGPGRCLRAARTRPTLTWNELRGRIRCVRGPANVARASARRACEK